MKPYINDMVRIDSTAQAGKVVDIKGGYAIVKFDDGSEARFTRTTGKEYKGYRRIVLTEEIEAAIEVEHFKRFQAAEIQIIDDTQRLGDSEVLILKAKSFGLWGQRYDEPRDRIFTVIFTPERVLDRDATSKLIDAARAAGTYHPDQGYDMYAVYFDGWVGQASTLGGRDTGRTQTAYSPRRTKDEILFELIGDEVVRRPTAYELGYER